MIIALSGLRSALTLNLHRVLTLTMPSGLYNLLEPPTTLYPDPQSQLEEEEGVLPGGGVQMTRHYL